MSRVKELEWTILFQFPSDIEDSLGFYPTINGEFKEFIAKGYNITDCKVWNNKNEAKEFAKSNCGKYNWQLFPTIIETTIS